MPRHVSGSTDAHALRLIAAGRIQYDPATGVILVDGRPRGVSDKTTGYNRVFCDGVYMPAHRLGWMCVNGPIKPGLVINHKDGNRRNNRIDNLEAVSRAQNVHHARKSPNYVGAPPVLIVHEAPIADEDRPIEDIMRGAIRRPTKRGGARVMRW